MEQHWRHRLRRQHQPHSNTTQASVSSNAISLAAAAAAAAAAATRPSGTQVSASPSSSSPSSMVIKEELSRPVDTGPGVGGGGVIGVAPRTALLANMASSSGVVATTTANAAAAAAAAAFYRPPAARVVVTNQPSNESELQLYRVLQHANLLAYYDTFIAQGGDDVRQLCEAGDEEFLEIMALVGMASKPLHVRRLQKALHEWLQNPGLFQTPLVPLTNFSSAAAVIRPSQPTPPPVLPPPNVGVATALSLPPVRPAVSGSPTLATPPAASSAPPLTTTPGASATPVACVATSGVGVTTSPAPSSQRATPPPPPASAAGTTAAGSPPSSRRPSRPSSSGSRSPVPLISSNSNKSVGEGSSSNTREQSASSTTSGTSPPYAHEYPSMSTSPGAMPVLVEEQISRIAATAASMARKLSLPSNFEPKLPNNKKKMGKDLDQVLSMCDSDPRKMDEIRRYSAIYGRFDCKRKPEKPLTMHEVSVNEAAAQLCAQMPALLLRRDELFPLARRVVRDSGYQYSKGHSRSQFVTEIPTKIFTATTDDIDIDDDHDDHDHDEEEEEEDNNNEEDNDSDNQEESNDHHNEDSNSSQQATLDVANEASVKLASEVRQLEARESDLKSQATLTLEQRSELMNISEQISRLDQRRRQMLERRHLRKRPRGGVSVESSSNLAAVDFEKQERKTHQEPHKHAGSLVLSASGGQIIAVRNPALPLAPSESESKRRRHLRPRAPNANLLVSEDNSDEEEQSHSIDDHSS